MADGCRGVERFCSDEWAGVLVWLGAGAAAGGERRGGGTGAAMLPLSAARLASEVDAVLTGASCLLKPC